MRVRTSEFEIPRGEPRSLLEGSGFEVRHTSHRHFTLQLWGPLPDTWSAALGVGLCRAGIRVVRGFGRRLDADVWLGEFELEALDDSEEPVLIDYLGLVRRPSESLRAPELRLAGHHRSLTSKHGGSLFLEVRAPDRLGFLGGLLTRIAQVGLVPVEFLIDTRGLPVLDRFFLKERGGECPGARTRRALGALLDQLSSARTSAIE